MEDETIKGIPTDYKPKEMELSSDMVVTKLEEGKTYVITLTKEFSNETIDHFTNSLSDFGRGKFGFIILNHATIKEQAQNDSESGD